MQRIIKILSLLLFLVFSKQGFSQCVGTQSSTMSPAGPYSPGQVVTVTYTLNNFTQVNDNWIIAFDIDLGVGWASITPISAPANPNPVNPNGTGSWIWDTQNTYPSGLNFGPGYRFQNSSWMYPDWGSSSLGPFTLSFQLTVGNSCTPQDLSVDVSAIGDCQTGGWNNGPCCGIVPFSVYSANSTGTTSTVTAGANQTICSGDTPNSLTATGSGAGTYSWSPSTNLNNASLQNPSFVNGLTATTTYTVTFTDSYGCTATDDVTITVSPDPSVVAGTSQTICNGGVPSPLTALGNSAGSYSWWPPSSFTNPNLQNPSFNTGVNTTTVYTVTFTDNNGCIATDTVTITTNPIPTVTLSAQPNPACVGDDIVLTANTSIPVNKFRFQYNNGGGWINMTSPGFSTINPITYLGITSTTQFRVKVREDNGCTNSSWSPVITVPVNTVVTPPISHN